MAELPANGVLGRPTLVLRKLDVEALDDVTVQTLYDTELEPKFPEGTAPWFELGWIANDHPRDEWLATELVAGTAKLKGEGETALFAVARTDTGEVIHTYREMRNAENASIQARLVVSAEIDADEEAPFEASSPVALSAPITEAQEGKTNG